MCLHRLCTPPTSTIPPVQPLHFLPPRPRSSPASLSIHASAASSSSSASASGRNLPWLVVGLGSPGSKFEGTRHNIGFEMIDAIVESEGIPLRSFQHKALLGKGTSFCGALRFMQGVNHHGGRPWWYGLAVVAVMYFPWSLSLPPAPLQAGPWRQSWRKAKRCQKLPSFAASWLIAGFLLFAFSSSQLPSYYLPVAPAIALLAAVHASQGASQEKGGVLSCLVPAILYLSLAVGFWFLPACLQNSGDSVAAQIGRLVNERRLHQFAVVLVALAGIVTFRIAEFGSRLRPVEVKEEAKSAKPILPMWIVHTTVMACFGGIFLTPVYSLTDSVRQAPLRHVAYAAGKEQVRSILEGNKTFLDCDLCLCVPSGTDSSRIHVKGRQAAVGRTPANKKLIGKEVVVLDGNSSEESPVQVTPSAVVVASVETFGAGKQVVAVKSVSTKVTCVSNHK